MLTKENSKAIAAICARLDGLPLAIELAAAHIRLFSPQEMQARLDSRLPLLTRGARNLPARQRTLRAAIDWSYNLLDQGEQMLFARLGVFVGGFTLSATEAICGSDAESDELFDVAEVIESLLDKNLLMQQEGADGEWRFNMLELIHDYSLERLRASGEEEKVRGRHAIYFLDMAELASPEMLGWKQTMWLEKLEQEHDNLRGVLRWALNTGNPTLALRLGGAMGNFWQVRGHNSEGRRWLEEAMRGGTHVPASVRAKALRALGYLDMVQGEFGQVTELDFVRFWVRE